MSSDIKNTIALLCKLFNIVYETNLKPEYFRLAKFNKTDENVVPILWNTLCTILYENSINAVQKRLYSLNYNRKEFYMLSTDNNHGSRELLLALAFLIPGALEKDLQKKLDNNPFPDNFGQSDASCRVREHEEFNWKKLKGNDLQNYKKWLRGKISSNNNMILDYNEQIDKIQEKYNKNLDMKAHSILTVHEILALKNTSIGEQFLQDTEPIINMLSVYTEWIKREKQFWKWMMTVLVEATKII